jgi:urate oxidase
LISLPCSLPGKDKVRLLKVHKDPRDPKQQSVVELSVQILLEGDIETSYTKADNSVVVATDTMKNTVYCKIYTWPLLI